MTTNATVGPCTNQGPAGHSRSSLTPGDTVNHTDPTGVRDPFGPPLPTAEEAAAAGRMGWNLRCNSCGGYGATWLPGMRPGWGALALCHPHEKELYAMRRRHEQELKSLTTVNFEQDRGQR